MDGNDPSDSNAGTSEGSAETGSETGGQTSGQGSENGTTSDPANKANGPARPAEETARGSVVQSVRNPGGNEEVKRRRGRPPGSRNKTTATTRTAKPIERTGWGVPCSQEQAESCARVCLSMTTPAYNTAFAVFERPPLLKSEVDFQRDAIVEYAMAYGDPLGKWGPVVMLAVSVMAPITNRIMPPEMSGLKDALEKEAAEEAKKAKLEVVK